MKLFSLKISIGMLVLVLACASLQAQDRGRESRGLKNLSIEQIASNRTQGLDKVLKLSDEQKIVIQDSYLEFLDNQRKIREKYPDNEDKFAKKMEKERNKLDKQFQQILTEEQFKLFKGQSEQRRQRAKNRER